MRTFKQFIKEADINPRGLKNLNKALNDPTFQGDKMDAEIIRQRNMINKFKGKSTDQGV